MALVLVTGSLFMSLSESEAAEGTSGFVSGSSGFDGAMVMPLMVVVIRCCSSGAIVMPAIVVRIKCFSSGAIVMPDKAVFIKSCSSVPQDAFEVETVNALHPTERTFGLKAKI